MKRLTTDNPENSNYLTLMNYCKYKDRKATLCWADGKENVDLCEYASKCCKEKGCNNITPDYIMENGLECDCEVATMYYCGVQAAENNSRLSQYENIGLTPDEIIQVLEYLISGDCTNIQFNYFEEIESAIEY